MSEPTSNNVHITAISAPVICEQTARKLLFVRPGMQTSQGRPVTVEIITNDEILAQFPRAGESYVLTLAIDHGEAPAVEQ